LTAIRLGHGKHRARSSHGRARPAALPSLLLGTAGAALIGLAVLGEPGATPASPSGGTEAVAALPEETSRVADERARLGARASRDRRATTPADAAGASPPTAAPTDAQAVAPPTAAPPSVPANPPAVVPAPAAPAPPAAEFVRPGDGARTSGYGPRWGRLHAGVDLAAGTGAPVRATAAGTVLSAGVESGYGKCVRIAHPDGTVTLYAHMSELLVETGRAVAVGEQIGREGNTGRSTGPHLHFEVRVDGTPVNPAAWLQARGVAV
jgi:murein DD-endopeptidase MepM/ murein hydrolase activator NlpD